MSLPCKSTCWWLRPVHACHFSLVCVAQLSGSVHLSGSVEWNCLRLQGQSLIDCQKSEWQLSPKQTFSSQTDVLHRTSACSWCFHDIVGLESTYLLKAIGFSDLRRSLDFFLFYRWGKWHLQKRRGLLPGNCQDVGLNWCLLILGTSRNKALSRVP